MKATKQEIEQAQSEREHWRRIAEWLGEGWRLYGWNGTESAVFNGPDGKLHEIGGALAGRLRSADACASAASPRLALACQSAVALAELIGRGWQPPVGEPSVTSADIAEAAWALGQEARQALAAAGCAAGAGDE